MSFLLLAGLLTFYLVRSLRSDSAGPAVSEAHQSQDGKENAGYTGSYWSQ